MIETVRAKLAAGGADVVMRGDISDPIDFFAELERYFEAGGDGELLTRILFVDVTPCETVPLRYRGTAVVGYENRPDCYEDLEFNYSCELVGFHLVPDGRRFAEFEIEAT